MSKQAVEESQQKHPNLVMLEMTNGYIFQSQMPATCSFKWLHKIFHLHSEENPFQEKKKFETKISIKHGNEKSG